MTRPQTSERRPVDTGTPFDDMATGSAHPSATESSRYAVRVSVIRRDGVLEVRILRNLTAAERRVRRALDDGRYGHLELVRVEPVAPGDRLDAQLALIDGGVADER